MANALHICKYKYYVSSNFRSVVAVFSCNTFVSAFVRLGPTVSANLTDADFTAATLQNTDLRKAVLIRTYSLKASEERERFEPGKKGGFRLFAEGTPLPSLPGFPCLSEPYWQGKNNREIASELYLTEGTIKNHITRILSQLKVRDRTQAVLWAQQNGVV